MSGSRVNSSVLLGGLFIAAAAAAVYLPSLRGAFMMDDDRYLTNNPIISSSDGLYRIWCTNQLIDYWPLTYTTFWFEWRLWGMSPTGYHVTNLILHIATCLLLWSILRKLAVPGGFLAALLFAIHPVNVEAVAWISQRNEMLAAFFLMLSLLCYLRQEEQSTTRPATILMGRCYWLSLLAFVLAVFSKSSAGILPLLLLLCLWWLHGRIRWRDVARTLPFFGIAVLATLVEIWFQGHGDPHPNASFGVRMVGSGAVVWFYLAKALAPIEQAFIYPHWIISLSDLRWWLPLAAALVVTVVLVWQRNLFKGNWVRPLLFAWLFFCIALAPVMGLTEAGFMVHSLVADRYQHLAIIGVISLVAAGWCYWRGQGGQLARWFANASAVVVVGALALLTWQRSRLYGEPVQLFQASLENNPQSYLAEIDLAVALRKANKIAEGIEHCRRALEINPNFYIGHNVLGVLLEDSGQHQLAIEQFKEALRLHPNYPEAHNNLGLLLAGIGRPAEAIEQYEHALGLRPDYAEARANLGNALSDTGQLDEAMQQYRRALEINPDLVVANYNLGNFLSRGGKFEQAIEHYRHALSFDPGNVDAHYNLGIALAQLGKMNEAIEQFQQTVELKPDFAAAQNNLGNALLAVDRPQEAIEHYQEAIRLKPDDVAFYVNLMKTYAALHRSAEAIATAEQGLPLAHETGQTGLAKQIDEWVKIYRRQETGTKEKQPGTDVDRPSAK